MRLQMIIFCLIFSINSFGQTNSDSWDTNYRKVKVDELIKFEKEYADSIKRIKNFKPVIEATPRRYRFEAKFLGEQKVIDNEVLNSIKKIYELQTGNKSTMRELFKNQFLFEINGLKYWMPIQEVLEKPFKEEVKKGESVLLYCAFFNEITVDRKHIMTFTINEFQK